MNLVVGFVFVSSITFCTIMIIDSKNINVTDFKLTNQLTRNKLPKIISEAANCSTCTNTNFRDIKSQVRLGNLSCGRRRKRAYIRPNVSNYNKETSISNVKSVFNYGKRTVRKFPLVIHKISNRDVSSNRVHFRQRRHHIKNVHRRFHTKQYRRNSLSNNTMKAQGSNQNTTKTRILKRESEQLYSRQTIPHEPFDENSYSLQTNVAENIDVPQVTVAENIGAEESFNPQLESMQLYSRQTIPHELFYGNRDSLQTNVAGNIDVPQVTVAENIYVSESSVPVETISNSQRESEHFYSRQAIPQEIEENRDSLQTNVAGNIVSQVTVAENIDAEKSSDTVETISNLQQEAFEKGLQIPSYVKTRDANEDISYEKLEKLLSILNQQLNDESSNVETTTGFSTLTINSTIAQKMASIKEVSQVSKSLVAVVGFLITMAVICQGYSTFLKYYAYKIYMKTTHPAERVSFFKFYFNRHRNKTDEEQLLVEKEMLDPILKGNHEVLIECVEVALDRMCLDDDSKLEQKYASKEHEDLLKRTLYTASH